MRKLFDLSMDRLICINHCRWKPEGSESFKLMGAAEVPKASPEAYRELTKVA